MRLTERAGDERWRESIPNGDGGGSVGVLADRPDDVLVAVPDRGDLGKGTIELKDMKTADPHGHARRPEGAGRLTRPVVWVGRALVGLGCSVLLGWMALAIYFDFSLLGPPWLRAGLGVLVPVGALVALWLVRPLRWVLAGILAAFVVVLAAWLAIPPSNERDWQPDVATLPFADIHGDRVIVHNVRNAEYRTETDYTVRLEDRALDLSKLRSLDLFLIHWGSPLIAHTIMSWGFEGDQYLAISIETRKEKGEQYSALRGFFRQYELIFVVADERDVVRLRTNYPRRGRLRLPARRAPRGRSRAAAPVPRGDQPAARAAPVVQRADGELHDGDPAPRPGRARAGRGGAGSSS